MCMHSSLPTQVKIRRRGVEARLRQTQQEGYAELRHRGETEKAAYEADLYVDVNRLMPDSR